MKKFLFGVIAVLCFGLAMEVEAAGKGKGGGRYNYKKCAPDEYLVYLADSNSYACVKKPKNSDVPLVIQNIEPAIVKPGETITIRGSGFSREKIDAVRFHYGGEVKDFKVVSPNEIQVKVPFETRSGTVQLVADIHLRLNSPVSAQTLKIRHELKITKVDPPQGKWADYVNVYQERIGNEGWESCKVIFGGVDLGPWNLNHYKSGAPLGMNVPKEVKNNEIVINCPGNGMRATSGNMFSFIVPKPLPKIVSIVPKEGIEQSNQITLFGTNLGNVQEITFNGVKGSINIKQSDLVRVITPRVDGAVKIVVKTPDGETTWNNYSIFKPKPLPEFKPQPIAKPTPPPAPIKITKNAAGETEYCFGAIGKGCGGFGKVEGSGGTRPGWLAAGCSEEVNGQRNCWVAPGSIRHDNCCVKNSYGKHCGGKYSDGSEAGEFNHNGKCDREWDDAVWDVKNGRAWLETFDSKNPADLTPVSNPRYAGGETNESRRLCAPNGTSISARHGTTYCCSGSGQKYWAIGVEDWIICGGSGGRSTQSIGGKRQADSPPMVVRTDMPPPKPGAGAPEKVVQKSEDESKKRMAEELAAKKKAEEEALAKKQAEAEELARQKARQEEAEILAKKKAEEEELARKRAAEEELAAMQKAEQEELARRQEEQQQQEEIARHERETQEPAPSPSQCGSGTRWSPTMQQCVDDRPIEQTARPDCASGTHWSPTLQSCQPD